MVFIILYDFLSTSITESDILHVFIHFNCNLKDLMIFSDESKYIINFNAKFHKSSNTLLNLAQNSLPGSKIMTFSDVSPRGSFMSNA